MRHSTHRHGVFHPIDMIADAICRALFRALGVLSSLVGYIPFLVIYPPSSDGRIPMVFPHTIGSCRRVCADEAHTTPVVVCIDYTSIILL